MSNFNRESIRERQARIVAEALAQAPLAKAAQAAQCRRSSEDSGDDFPANERPVTWAASLDSDEDFDEAVEVPEHVKGTRGVQIRNACITYFPPLEGNLDRYLPLTAKELSLHILKPSHASIDFYVTSLEVAPKTGRLHGHMYIEFSQPKTILQIQKMIGTMRSKVFMRKGTQKQAIDYVFKRDKYESKHFTQLSEWLYRQQPRMDPEDVPDPVPDVNLVLPFVFGQMKNQGARADLDRFVEMATQGITRAEFLARERGAGLRYIKYYSDACAIFDGLDRNDVARANKRAAYDEYLEACDRRQVAPQRFFEWECEHDFKWNEISRRQHNLRVAEAMDERDHTDSLMTRGTINKDILEGANGEDQDSDGVDGPLDDITDEIKRLEYAESHEDEDEDEGELIG